MTELDSFDMLPLKAQLVRLRAVAMEAIKRYPIDVARVRQVSHGENTTFRVMASDGADFLLRVHRPQRHGRGVDSTAAVKSEMRWLEAIARESSVSAPVPLPATAGELTVVVESPAVPGERVCSVLRWMNGQLRDGSASPVHLGRVGRVMAQLHEHAVHWKRPTDFVRMNWNWQTIFGDVMVYGKVGAGEAWALLPPKLEGEFHRVADHVGGVMNELGDGPDAVGLIHADMHLSNVLFQAGEARPIDFDDCGVGYWLYDMAVALWELRHKDNYSQFRAEFLSGYRSVRPIDDELLRHLDSFIAAREVAFGLWFAGMAQSNESFRAKFDKEMAFIEGSLNRVLPATAR